MNGDIITIKDKNLIVGNNPIIPFIEGDGIGIDIWSTSKKVIDNAVEKAYSGSKKIEWLEVLAGETVKSRPVDNLLRGPLKSALIRAQKVEDCADRHRDQQT